MMGVSTLAERLAGLVAEGYGDREVRIATPAYELNADGEWDGDWMEGPCGWVEVSINDKGKLGVTLTPDLTT